MQSIGGLPRALGGLLALVLFSASPGSALTITYDLDFEFSGGTPPAGGTPWMTITLDDSFATDSVRVTVSNVGLTGVEFASEVSLNLDPSLDPTQLAFTNVNVAAVGSITYSKGVDAFQADGDGKFDILVTLPPPPGGFAAKFSAGETIVFDIGGITGLTASSFDFTSAPGGGAGTFHAAAHVQGIGAGGEDSGWIGDAPEPGALGLMGIGLLGLAASFQRSRKA